MTEHSQEYIAFMQKAEALQALWVPGAGDWAWADEDIKAVLLVNIWPPQRKGGLATIEAAVYGEEVGPCSYEFIEGEITWLPSLFQLIRVIEGRWPSVQIGIRPSGNELWPRVHIWAAAECVRWDPEGAGFWRCEACGGDNLHEQTDGSVTCGPWPEDISGRAHDKWDGGSGLPVCPHCGWSEGKDLMLAAAQLAARAVEEK